AGILLCMFACRMVLLRVNGCLPVTLKADLEKVEKGPAAGIYILADQAKAWNFSYDELKSLIKGNENVLYIGQEQLFYVTFCDRVTVPSVQGTTVFNEMYSRYYETFPEKEPDIIVRDASFDVNPAYYYSNENEYIYNWLRDNYMTYETKNNGFYEVIYIIKK
ncbi:MAG: hypothetical protein K5776_09435, partial [Lachnospiraceae bacterium]|nr:hypothetical protein [Lachnospiraceae bacterium]